MSADEALLAANRAVDFTIGMSFVARRLSFTSDSDLADQPSGYKQTVPVAGGVMDATVYPMAFSHKNNGLITGLGLEVMYDKVININSQKKYVDDMMDSADREPRDRRGSVLDRCRVALSGEPGAGGRRQDPVLEPAVQHRADVRERSMATDVPNVHYQMAEPKAVR